MSTNQKLRAPAPLLEIDATALIHRSPSVVSAAVDEEVVIMQPTNGRCFELDEIGKDIWARLETPQNLNALIDKLAADYNADRAVIADDVRGLLSRWAERDMVQFKPKA
jgi:Coenzyme PQQ synthesis protein D (PqqD)